MISGVNLFFSFFFPHHEWESSIRNIGEKINFESRERERIISRWEMQGERKKGRIIGERRTRIERDKKESLSVMLANASYGFGFVTQSRCYLHARMMPVRAEYTIHTRINIRVTGHRRSSGSIGIFCCRDV